MLHGALLPVAKSNPAKPIRRNIILLVPDDSWQSPEHFSSSSLSRSTPKMLLINLLNGLLYVHFKSFITFQECFALERDPGASSGSSADFLVKEKQIRAVFR